MTLSLQLLWNYWSISHETWYVDRTSYCVMHIGRKFWCPHFCGSYAPWNLENIRKSTNNLSFLCQCFINEITASDAGPDIIRFHLFKLDIKQNNISTVILLNKCLVYQRDPRHLQGSRVVYIFFLHNEVRVVPNI